MTFLTYLCFLDGAIRPADFVRLVRQYSVGFEPARLDWSPGSQRVKSLERGMQRLAQMQVVSWVSVESASDLYRFELGGIAGWPADVIVWQTPDWPDEELISAATQIPGFTAALVGDADDVYWQSETQTQAFEHAGRRLKSLPLSWDEDFEEYVVDISHNPGRRVPAPAMWLWAASKMWFGPAAAIVLDMERLRSFDARKPVKQERDVIIIELFDPAERVKVIRREQERFRAWMGYDSLERDAALLAGKIADPSVEVETGRFPHGGERLVTEWYDAGGLHVPRSRATRRSITEFDAVGRVVWRSGLVATQDV
jgi:hypothetical protein